MAHWSRVLCLMAWHCHESWVVPAGVSTALAVLGGEIPTRIDSCNIWGGGQTVEESIFLLARGGLAYRFLPGPVSRVFARVDPT